MSNESNPDRIQNFTSQSFNYSRTSHEKLMPIPRPQKGGTELVVTIQAAETSTGPILEKSDHWWKSSRVLR